VDGKVDIISVNNADTTISINGSTATITAGGNGHHGIMSMHDGPGVIPRILLNAKSGTLAINRKVEPTSLSTYQVIALHGETGDVSIGGNGQDGDLVLFAAGFTSSSPASHKSNATIHLRAQDGIVRAGGGGVNGRMLVLGSDGSARISIEGSTGDIVLANADCAEEFDLADEAEPGTVLCFDDVGLLRPSRTPYDPCVAGVVSGAGSYRPGIVLDRRGHDHRRPRRPVALLGKVFCKVEAESAPVRPGSLLTTSDMPGHAMAATDRDRAFGCVLGKALRGLASGTGLVPVLVALQ
jgi:hypothetical protein